MIATLGGFAALLCGLVGFGPGAVLCNHASALTLWAIEGLVRLSVKLPGAFLPAHFTTPGLGPVALSTLMTVIFIGYAKHWKTKAGTGWWWPPFAVVAATLIFGVTFG